MSTGEVLFEPKRFGRIEVDPLVLGGTPVVQGTRVSVAVIVSAVADGLSVRRICKEYPSLCEEDVRAALRFASILAYEKNPVISGGWEEALMGG
ncbi:MAG: DUF433 domain-containing protein [Chloroflexi bacterium]|nr:DUF433 domain-containing protein [Chloroflexota bacterium]